jgi:DNA-binding NtrC family response regulator
MKKTPFTVLIVDRNPKIRGFLKREMESAGFRVQVAENAGQAVNRIYHPDPVDLIVLDPDLPDMDNCRVLASMWGRLPQLPLVIHTFASVYKECVECPSIPDEAVFVEKKGDSIERLKQVVLDILINRETCVWKR